MRCPICGVEFDFAASPAKPFCSDRCRLIDLGRWLDEGYSLPVPPNLDADELPEPEQSANGEAHED